MLRVIKIIEGTSVDGPGLRTSVYFAGCRHRCPGCHNPQSWDFNAGTEMTADEIMDTIKRNGFNVTLSGGDPFYQPADELLDLIRKINAEGLTVWAYTGFLYEELLENPAHRAIVDSLEAVVDGPFIESLRDTDLIFRGSSNQRIILSGGKNYLPL